MNLIHSFKTEGWVWNVLPYYNVLAFLSHLLLSVCPCIHLLGYKVNISRLSLNMYLCTYSYVDGSCILLISSSIKYLFTFLSCTSVWHVGLHENKHENKHLSVGFLPKCTAVHVCIPVAALLSYPRPFCTNTGPDRSPQQTSEVGQS